MATSHPPPERGAISPYLLLVIPPLCWAGNFVVGRAMHADIPPAALTFWRWAVAAMVLLPLAGLTAWRLRRDVLRHWRLLAVLAASGVVGFQYCVYRGLQTTTAINGVLIIATIPAVIPAIAYGLDGTGLRLRQAAGIGLSMLGVGIVILQGDLALLATRRLATGDAWMALAVPMWALYSVLVRRLPAAVPPLVLLLASVVVGLVLAAPLYVADIAAGRGFAVELPTIAAIAYVGVFASVIAFACWNRGVRAVGAAKAGLFIHLMPVFAAVLATLFLDEQLRAFHVAGAALIAAGLYLSSTTGRAA
jgi:drug/metabolite transporter (DMT)-like permease